MTLEPCVPHKAMITDGRQYDLKTFFLVLSAMVDEVTLRKIQLITLHKTEAWSCLKKKSTRNNNKNLQYDSPSEFTLARVKALFLPD